MKRSGLTLLELILGITISGILSLTLYTAFSQIQRSARSLDRIILIDNKVVILQNLLEKDISGVFVPNIKEVEQQKRIELSQPDENKDEKNKKEKQPQKKKEKVAKSKKLEKAFFGENQNKNIKEVTFITCNPLQIYGQATPRIVRVIYKLKESKDSKDAYTLYRQESLDIKYTGKGFEFEVIDNIKSLSFEYLIPESKNKDKKITDADRTQFEKCKSLDSWNSDVSNKDNSFIIPLYVNVKLSLWEDNLHNRSQDFEFKYFIYAFDSQFEKKTKGQLAFEEFSKKMKMLTGGKDDDDDENEED